MNRNLGRYDKDRLFWLTALLTDAINVGLVTGRPNRSPAPPLGAKWNTLPGYSGSFSSWTTLARSLFTSSLSEASLTARWSDNQLLPARAASRRRNEYACPLPWQLTEKFFRSMISKFLGLFVRSGRSNVGHIPSRIVAVTLACRVSGGWRLDRNRLTNEVNSCSTTSS
jgi:hypothetical protein